MSNVNIHNFSPEILSFGGKKRALFQVSCCGWSVTKSYLTLCDLMDCSTPGFPASLSPWVCSNCVNDAIQPSHSLSPPSPPALNLSQLHGLFTESALRIRWPNYWSFNINPSNEYSGLISFRIDWFDLLVVQGTPKSLLQHHSSKASILQCPAFFMTDSRTCTWPLGKP